MKKALSILLIAILAVSCLPLAGCGGSGYTLMTVEDMKKTEDSRFKSLGRKMDDHEELDDSDYVCVLNESFSDSSAIPSEQDGHPVVYLTAESTFSNTKATKITVPESVKIVEYLLPDGNQELTALELPEGVTIIDSFCDCDSLEGVDFSKPAEITNSFVGCEKLKSDVFEVSQNAENCTGVFQEGVTHKYIGMEFHFKEVKEVDNESFLSTLDTPKGKWVEADFEFDGKTYAKTKVESLLSKDNILLNGAAPSEYKTTIPSGAIAYVADDSLHTDKYLVSVFYDVPKDFVVYSAEATYSDKVE